MIATRPRNANPIVLSQLGATSTGIGKDHGPEKSGDGDNPSSGRGRHAKSYDTLGTIPRVRADTATARPGMAKATYIAASTAEVNSSRVRLISRCLGATTYKGIISHV